MNPRAFLVFLGVAMAWPPAAGAQQPLPVVGFLDPASAGHRERLVGSFRKGLEQSGYVEGQNILIEYRWADGENSRLPALAADLVNRRVAVIAASGGIPSAHAAKAATTTIPIVFLTATDPVEFGLVARLNRPGGNLTGVTTLGVEVGQKRLELVRELVPRTTTVALLINPSSPLSDTIARELQPVARTLGLQLHVLKASTGEELNAAFERAALLRAGALVIGIDAFFISRSKHVAELSRRHAIPTIFQNREFVEAGGLMSYGGSGEDAYRHVGIYVGRILKGESPSDLPVQQSTRVELIINLKTARALGVDVPPTLLARADEVIE